MNPDWNQLGLARRGDESAWRALVERHSPRLLKMVLLITGSHAAAQDIVQETFLDLYHRGPRHSRGSLGGYLSTVAYRMALKEKRRSGNLRALDYAEEPANDPSPLGLTLERERDRAVNEVIQSMEESHRDVLILRFYGGHSYGEIAGICGLPLGTVKSRIFNALKKCRIMLHEKGVTE